MSDRLKTTVANKVRKFLESPHYKPLRSDAEALCNTIEQQAKRMAELEATTTMAVNECAALAKKAATQDALAARVKVLEAVCRSVNSYYSASLDHQPPYVALARKAIDEETP